MYSESSSSGLSLNFPTKEEWDSYQKEQHWLAMKAYGTLRNKYGVWASNQGKYVKSTKNFNTKRGESWGDSWYMEDEYAKWKRNN
jgi:hypothetical protein